MLVMRCDAIEDIKIRAGFIMHHSTMNEIRYKMATIQIQI